MWTRIRTGWLPRMFVAALLLVLFAASPVFARNREPKSGVLVVFVSDSRTKKPVAGVGVTVRRPGWYVSDTHREPEWFATTDSAGRARLVGIAPRMYYADFCQENYDGRKFVVDIRSGKTFKIRTELTYVGPPKCRRCEVRFKFDGSPVGLDTVPAPRKKL